MLLELVVSNLGVIQDASVLLGQGMTALTGETGAGKTLVVEAIELLLGGKADPVLVRTGAEEARVDGRFIVADEETVLTRVVPRVGRSRAYIDGRPVSVGALSELASTIVDLHGQHGHQRLLLGASQRDAIDAFGRVDCARLREIRSERRQRLTNREALGGDERARAREIDLLTYQVDELDSAAIVGANEDDDLRAEEDLLANSQVHRDTLLASIEALSADDGVLTLLGVVGQQLTGKSIFDNEAQRVRAATSEIDDVALELRAHLAKIDDNPERLSQIRQRRHLLRQMRRKYGDTLDAVLTFYAEAARRLADLHSHDERAAALEAELSDLAQHERTERNRVAAARRAAAAPFERTVQQHLRRLALPNARFSVEVMLDADSETVVMTAPHAAVDSQVIFMFSANPGTELAPLSKVASGGELARVMLALQLGLLDASANRDPTVLVFDEVDAGIGGETALSVGDALAELGTNRQVLVVTHLAQVAASADFQIHVRKQLVDDGEGRQRTETHVGRLSEGDRVAEVARMLAGDPASPAALRHAKDLLAARRSSRRALLEIPAPSAAGVVKRKTRSEMKGKTRAELPDSSPSPQTTPQTTPQQTPQPTPQPTPSPEPSPSQPRRRKKA